MGVSAYASNRYPNASPSKTLKILCMEGGMEVSPHASNSYSNSLPSKTLKPSSWKEAWVLVYTHQTDIAMLHLQQH